MNTQIHPKWHTITVTCTCGSTFESASTQDAIHVDICSQCHPFFTNEMRFVDRQGRVDRFRQKMQIAATRASDKKKKKAAKQQSDTILSFKELKEQQKSAQQ